MNNGTDKQDNIDAIFQKRPEWMSVEQWSEIVRDCRDFINSLVERVQAERPAESKDER